MPREYYVYPNGTSIAVAGNNEYATQIPMSASDATDVATKINSKEPLYKYTYTATDTTNKLKINILPAQWMMSFTVNLYQGYRATKILISGYDYDSNYWYQPEACILGDGNHDDTITVYFGYDDVNELWVGFDGSNYTGLSISDVSIGYKNISDWSNLFTISRVSTLSTIQTTVTAYSSAHVSGGLSDSDDGTRITASYNATALQSTTYLCAWDNYKIGAINQSNVKSGTVNGIYTLNGGQQPPSYFGKNTVGFLMSNVALSSDNHYKNIMYMDCYSGNDVGGVTALALDREEAKGWIMQSGASRATWDHAAELVTSGNIGSQNVQSATRTIPYVGNGSDNIAALKAIFPSVPKSVGAVVKTVHGSHSMAFGWFLDGASYATVGTAYGGWFISDYGTPSWVGINAGTWTAANFITNKNASSYFVVQQVNHTVSGGATAGWHQNLSVSCAKTGYTPIAVFGGPFSGASSAASIWWMGERLDGTTIKYSYNSARSDTGNLTFSFQVLYVKQ